MFTSQRPDSCCALRIYMPTRWLRFVAVRSLFGRPRRVTLLSQNRLDLPVQQRFRAASVRCLRLRATLLEKALLQSSRSLTLLYSIRWHGGRFTELSLCQILHCLCFRPLSLVFWARGFANGACVRGSPSTVLRGEMHFLRTAMCFEGL